MTITAYKLTIDQIIGDEEVTKSLTYRGNENVIIESNILSKYDQSDIHEPESCRILFPRHILEAFLDMVKI